MQEVEEENLSREDSHQHINESTRKRKPKTVGTDPDEDAEDRRRTVEAYEQTKRQREMKAQRALEDLMEPSKSIP